MHTTVFKHCERFEPNDVVLMTLLLILKIFHTLFRCFQNDLEQAHPSWEMISNQHYKTIFISINSRIFPNALELYTKNFAKSNWFQTLTGRKFRKCDDFLLYKFYMKISCVCIITGNKSAWNIPRKIYAEKRRNFQNSFLTFKYWTNIKQIPEMITNKSTLQPQVEKLPLKFEGNVSEPVFVSNCIG